MGLIERLTADVVSLTGALRTLKLTTPIAKNPTRVFPQVISELADKYGDAPALLSDRERFSYRELAARSNRYSRWALAQGVSKGDTVCLMMPGRPEFLALWVGVTRVGGVVALINTNLTGMALAHCINVVSPKHIIVAAELYESLETARAHIAGDATIWLHGDADANFARIDRAVDALAGDELAPADRRTLTIEDRALYIYTSGTTGLPKAANMNHYRVMLASHAFAGVMDTRAERPHVRLPAALSFRRRPARDRRAAAARRLGGDPREILRARFLGRHRALGLHLLPVYRRAVPLPHQLAAASEGARASAAAGLRQRLAVRRLAGIQAALPDPEDHRVLCRDRRQRLAVQFRGQGRRHRPAAVVHRRPLPDQDRPLRRGAPAAGSRRERASASSARPTSPAR